MGSIKSRFDNLLELVDSVVTRIDGMHSEAKEFGTGIPLYRSEIHTIQAIGFNPGINVTRLAEEMGVTKGAISQTVTKLEKKGLIMRYTAEDNRKEVKLALTGLGETGHRNHLKFHSAMYDIARELFGDRLEEKTDNLIEAMKDIESVIDIFEKEHS